MNVIDNRIPEQQGRVTLTINIWQSIRRHAEDIFILPSLILLFLFLGFSSDNFFSVITLTTILNQFPALTFVTVGMTLVLIVAGIAWSVGPTMGFCAQPSSLLLSLGVYRCGWLA